MDYVEAFETLAALVAATPVITQAVKKIINKDLPSWANQLISWVIGILLTMFGWFFNLGFLEPMTWWAALIVGFGVSLAANGVFDTGFVKWLLELIFGKINKSGNGLDKQ